MKNLKPLILIFTIVMLFSCKKESYTNATIIKNCTGTYLRVLDKEYFVCNVKKTASFDNQQKVLASFNLIKECKSLSIGNPICAMYYPNNGIANINAIKKL